MKFGITRWKTVPSYRAPLFRSPLHGSVHSFSPVASSTKFATVFGACSGMRRTVNEPMVVTKVAVVIARPFRSRESESSGRGRGAGSPAAEAGVLLRAARLVRQPGAAPARPAEVSRSRCALVELGDAAPVELPVDAVVDHATSRSAASRNRPRLMLHPSP